ncbi:multidrug DMT transporter permease [Paenibacillus sp. J23TS9]|uniref:DMT family transporter n=1 Tax=Paenibacillus sp. J23TS9 TaxID=2807193 RepID=UPI001B091879|nr:DMT family transporter [Paenibacillus sp. J23TS9]GIP28220.1 multidrug DMT transporter permease [Paenibacillus sp. J23TS9]
MKRSLYGYLILLSLIWGGSFFFIKILLPYYRPGSIAFLRSSFGILAILLYMLIRRQSIRFRQIPWVPIVIVGLLQTAVPWCLIGFSETRLTSGTASVLNATTPLWTLILGVLFFGRKSNRFQWMGLGLGFLGLLVVLDIDPSKIFSDDLTGFAAMLIATFFYGLSSQLSKKYLQKVTLVETVLCTLAVGCFGSGVMAFGFEPFSLSPLFQNGTVILAFIGLGCFGSAVAYFLFYHLVQKGSAEFSTMSTYLIPVTAIIWGLLLLDEPVHFSLLAGLALILCGVFLTGGLPRKSPEIKAKGELQG